VSDEPATPDAVAEEQRRLDRLRRQTDLVSALLCQARMSRHEAEALVVQARAEALALFPDKAQVFDLVLAPRFQRILDERWPKGRVLPFRQGPAGEPDPSG
jgi:hypothetical protein